MSSRFVAVALVFTYSTLHCPSPTLVTTATQTDPVVACDKPSTATSVIHDRSRVDHNAPHADRSDVDRPRNLPELVAAIFGFALLGCVYYYTHTSGLHGYGVRVW